MLITDSYEELSGENVSSMLYFFTESHYGNGSVLYLRFATGKISKTLMWTDINSHQGNRPIASGRKISAKKKSFRLLSSRLNLALSKNGKTNKNVKHRRSDSFKENIHRLFQNQNYCFYKNSYSCTQVCHHQHQDYHHLVIFQSSYHRDFSAVRVFR